MYKPIVLQGSCAGGEAYYLPRTSHTSSGLRAHVHVVRTQALRNWHARVLSELPKSRPGQVEMPATRAKRVRDTTANDLLASYPPCLTPNCCDHSARIVVAAQVVLDCLLFEPSIQLIEEVAAGATGSGGAGRLPAQLLPTHPLRSELLLSFCEELRE